MKSRNIKRGEIYYADLSPVKGSEQDGMRPVLILQNNIGNKYSPTVIIAPITTQPKKQIPTHVLIPPIGNLEEVSCILLEQIRTIDKSRLLEKVGSLCIMTDVDVALAISVGLCPTCA